MIEGALWFHGDKPTEYTLSSMVTLYENEDFTYRSDLSFDGEGLTLNYPSTLDTIVKGYSSITTNTTYKTLIEEAVNTVLGQYKSILEKDIS